MINSIDVTELRRKFAKSNFEGTHMRFTRLRLENWRNFLSVDVPLQKRAFLVGPNASGKSNLLDVFRFLRDIADDKGGFQFAVQKRQGVSILRSLHARRYPNIVVEVEMELDAGEPWTYRIEFSQNNLRKPILEKEIVKKGTEVLLDRPDNEDDGDSARLTQTHLEQISANKLFRPVADFLAKVRYLHIVPQLVREPERSVGRTKDPFGGDFLEQIADTPKKTRESRLSHITRALQVAIPNLKELSLSRDEKGIPHLKGLYEHWRPNAGWQTEDQFSDGTLRLLGLLWVLLDGQAPLLLEEPELSLHCAVVRYIPGMLARLSGRTGRQVILSTQSTDLLNDEGIAPEEVFLLRPTREGTVIDVAARNYDIRGLLEKGMPMGRAVLPHTQPPEIEKLNLLFRD